MHWLFFTHCPYQFQSSFHPRLKKPTFRYSFQRRDSAHEIWMYKKKASWQLQIIIWSTVRETNLLPLSLLATSFFLPRIQTRMMWWRIWPRAPIPEHIWKRFLPPYRTNSACIQSAGRAFPKAPRPAPGEQSGFIVDVLYTAGGKTEEAQCKEE